MLKLPKKLEDLVMGLSLLTLVGASSCSKGSPSSPGETPTDPEELVIETQSTNEEGITEFSTGKSIIVKNEQDHPVPNTQVTYFSDGEYHAFISPQGEYFSATTISGNLEPDTLRLKTFDEHGSDIRIVRTPGLSDLLFKFSKDLMGQNQGRSEDCDIYDYTISGEYALLSYSVVEGILMYIGLDWMATIVGEIIELSGITDDEDFKEYLGNNNWDHYTLTDVVLEDPPVSTTLSVRFASNAPFLIQNEVTINGRNAEIEVRISDRSNYDNPQYGIINDATVTCLGPTSLPDKWYQFVLSKKSLPDPPTVIHNTGGVVGGIFNSHYENLAPGEYTGHLIYCDDTFWTWSEDAPIHYGYNAEFELIEFEIE
jgi:hypothetical protein